MYEGYSPQEVIFPHARDGPHGHSRCVADQRGGRINTGFSQGCLVVLRDHINLQGTNPLIGPNDEAIWRTLSRHDAGVLETLSGRGAGRRKAAGGLEIAQGVYAALTGPSYETPAEIRYLRTIGADLIGMSTAAGSDCRRAYGDSGARNFLRDEYGGGHSRSNRLRRGSDGNRRAREGGFCGAASRCDSAHE